MLMCFFVACRFSGGDDRIRTCEGLLTLNGLANRRLQPLGHISGEHAKNYSSRQVNIVKAGLDLSKSYFGSNTQLRANGAKCKSLGQRPRADHPQLGSAEGARYQAWTVTTQEVCSLRRKFRAFSAFVIAGISLGRCPRLFHLAPFGAGKGIPARRSQSTIPADRH